MNQYSVMYKTPITFCQALEKIRLLPYFYLVASSITKSILSLSLASCLLRFRTNLL